MSASNELRRSRKRHGNEGRATAERQRSKVEVRGHQAAGAQLEQEVPVPLTSFRSRFRHKRSAVENRFLRKTTQTLASCENEERVFTDHRVLKKATRPQETPSLPVCLRSIFCLRHIVNLFTHVPSGEYFCLPWHILCKSVLNRTFLAILTSVNNKS